MAMSKGGIVALVVGLAGVVAICVVVGVGAVLVNVMGARGEAPAREPLSARLDTKGPYLILSTEAAAEKYREAFAVAKTLHPGAAEAIFSPADLETARRALARHQPRYVLVLILPDELDVNFVWRWLELTTELDEDPFVDVMTGFVTGESPAAAAAFVRRIAAVAAGRVKLPGAAVDNLGPNEMATPTAFNKMSKNFMIPVLAERLGSNTISHGVRGFSEERMGSMDGAGLVHFGGHGYPDRIVDGLNGLWVRKLKLSPCVVFNGACYTGVTGRWFDTMGPVKERIVLPDLSFGLSLLSHSTVGYLAALHSDHGIPVYQELEYLAYTGASLGQVIKHTHDGVILASGGRLPPFETLSDGMAPLSWTPSQFMLKGTAARVLFGDPALVVMDAFTARPFAITVKDDGDSLLVTAVLKNAALKSTFTDTYYADLASNKRLFNDRALIVCELPPGWDAVGTLEVIQATAGAATLEHRLVGFGVERDGETRLLHFQVDFPSTGYMQSPFRRAGAQVLVRARR